MINYKTNQEQKKKILKYNPLSYALVQQTTSAYDMLGSMPGPGYPEMSLKVKITLGSISVPWGNCAPPPSCFEDLAIRNHRLNLSLESEARGFNTMWGKSVLSNYLSVLSGKVLGCT